MSNRPPNPYSAVEVRRALARVSKEVGPAGPAGAAGADGVDGVDGVDGADGGVGAPGIVHGLTFYFHNVESDIIGDM